MNEEIIGQGAVNIRFKAMPSQRDVVRGNRIGENFSESHRDVGRPGLREVAGKDRGDQVERFTNLRDVGGESAVE